MIRLKPANLKKSSRQTPEHDPVGTGTPHERLAAAMPTPALAPSSLPEPTAETRQLVNALFQPGIALTQEQVAQWKQSLRQLVQEGAAAVPAMREFLARNVDLDLGPEGSP